MSTRQFPRAVALISLGAASLASQPPARPALVARLDSIAGAPVKSGAIAGLAVAVVKGRDTLLFKGYGLADLENQVPVTPQTVFRIGSITKQFTSAVVMQLVEEGKVGLDDDLTKYIPNFPTHGRRILVRHLLNHTSGIASYTDVGPRFGAVMRLDLTRDSLIGIVARDSLLFEPGTHFYYNNTGYFMLGMIVEKVTGKKYGDHLAERLFTPHGLSGTVYCDSRRIIPRRAQGYDRSSTGLVNTAFISMELPYAAGSLCSTVGDLVAWSGKLAAGAIVSAASYRAMTTPVKLPSKRPMTYGYGLVADTLAGHRVVAHGGGINGFVSELTQLPDDSLIIAVLANTAPAPSSQVANAIARVVLGLPPAQAPSPPRDLPVSAEERARYVGTYSVTRPDGTKRGVRVFEENSQLMFRQDGLAAVKLARQEGDVFVATGQGRIAFDVTDSRATGFLMGGGARTFEAVRVPARDR